MSQTKLPEAQVLPTVLEVSGVKLGAAACGRCQQLRSCNGMNNIT